MSILASRGVRVIDGGDASAPNNGCLYLATFYSRTGKGSASRIAALRQKAFDLAQGEAKQNPYYMYLVGTFYRDGVTVVREPHRASEWFDKACAGNDAEGCIAAGAMLLGAKPPDYEAAAVDFEKACAAGFDESCTRSAEARKRLPLGTGGKHGGCACRVGGPGDAPVPGAVLLALLALLALTRRPTR